MEQLEAFGWAVVAVITAVSWAAWQRGALGWAGRVALGLLALAATAVAVAMFLAGQRMRWTSEGPGILLVMLILGVSTLLAVSLWIATVKAFARHRPRPPTAAGQAGRTLPRRRQIMLGLVVLVSAVAGGSALYRARRDKPAHDASIAAVRFIGGKDSAASLDVGGVLKLWALTAPLPEGNERSSPYSMQAKVEVAGARGALDMWIDAGGRHIAVLKESGISLFEVDRPRGQAQLRYTVRGAARAAAAHGEGFVIALSDGLGWFSPASAEPVRTVPWEGTVTAIDALGDGTVALADSTGRVAVIKRSGSDASLLGAVPFAVKTIAFSADGAGLLVLGSEGNAVTFTIANGASRPAQATYGPIARPLLGPTALCCSGQAARCIGVDTTTGRSFAAFSGIVRSYDRLDAAPGAVLIASGSELVVVSMPGPGYHGGSALLRDPRF